MSRVFFLSRRSSRWAQACLCFSLLSVSAVAAAANAAPAPTAASSFASLLQVLFGLGLVLAAIAGTAWLLRRLAPGQVSAASSLRVVGGVAVGPKERVVLVDVGETRLVLGVAPGHVSTLHQMPRPQDESVPIAADLPVGQFATRLKALLNKREGA